MRDVHRLEHIQTHCRDVLYDLERCAQTYEAFVQKPKLMERMRVALYHIGELAEGLTDTFRAVPQDRVVWNAVCLWALLRTQPVQSLDTLWLWYTVYEEVPNLLFYCCDAMQGKYQTANPQ